MNFYEFAGAHPVLTVILALIAAGFPPAIIKALRGPRKITINTKNVPKS